MWSLFRPYRFKNVINAILCNIALQAFKGTLQIQARKQNHCIQIPFTKF